MIFSKALLEWDFRIIVWWLEHSLTSSFLGNWMSIDLFQSLSYLRVSHTFLHRIITIFVPISPVTFIGSCCIYDRNLAVYHSERLESIRVVGTDRKIPVND